MCPQARDDWPRHDIGPTFVKCVPKTRLVCPGTEISPTFVECVPNPEPDDAAVCADRPFVDAPGAGCVGAGEARDFAIVSSGPLEFSGFGGPPYLAT